MGSELAPILEALIWAESLLATKSLVNGEKSFFRLQSKNISKHHEIMSK